MNESYIAISDWRLFSAGQPTSSTTVILDQLQDLVTNSDEYMVWGVNHTCDLSDPLTWLSYSLERGIISQDEASAAAIDLQVNRPAFMPADLVAARLTAAAGSCPFCGHEPEISWGLWWDNQWREDFWRIQTLCAHTEHAGADSNNPPERMLASARSWRGPRWPFRGCESIVMSDGQTLVPGWEGASAIRFSGDRPCARRGCQG